jgi:hypothetical protein
MVWQVAHDGAGNRFARAIQTTGAKPRINEWLPACSRKNPGRSEAAARPCSTRRCRSVNEAPRDEL